MDPVFASIQTAIGQTDGGPAANFANGLEYESLIARIASSLGKAKPDRRLSKWDGNSVYNLGNRNVSPDDLRRLTNAFFSKIIERTGVPADCFDQSLRDDLTAWLVKYVRYEALLAEEDDAPSP